MPKRANVHIDAPLTNLAIQYKNPMFVADKVLPVLPVMKESDKYYIFGREELQEVMTIRAIGSKSNEWDWDVSTASYQCEEYALSHLVPDRIVSNADSPVRPRMTSMQKLMKVIMLGYEKRTMNLVTGGALTSGNPTVQWDQSSGVVIEKDCDTAKETIQLAAGVMPNYMLMNSDVKNYVKRDATVRNLIRYTITGSGGQQLLVDGELPPVLWNLATTIAAATEDTAKKGQTASYSYIWPDDVLIWYAEPNPSLEALSLGYTFRVNGGIKVKTWRDEPRNGEMIEPSVIQNEKLVATAAGYLIDNVLS